MNSVPRRIIFVCSGNICRSPLAEGLAKLKFAEHGLSSQIISMGTLGINGRKAEPFMVQIAAEMGCDLSQHRSQGVNRAVLNMTDLIFIMDRAQYMMLSQYAPNCVPKIRWLGEYLNPPQQEIRDPMGKSREVFKEVATEIEQSIDRWVTSLL